MSTTGLEQASDAMRAHPAAAGAHHLPGTPGSHEISVYDAINIALRHRHVVVSIVLLLFAGVFGYALLQPRRFAASAWFMPQLSEAGGSPLAGVAAQFGIAVPSSQTGQSPLFYAELLRSREILRAVVRARYAVASDTGSTSATLVELYGVRKGGTLDRENTAIELLKEDLSAHAELQTGLVKLEVRSRIAPLAFLIAERLLAQLSDFNLNQRRSQASAERRFIEERLVELRAELAEAESRHQAFLARNREFRSSPELTFQNDRLARDVAMRQQVYTSFAEAYERAKIDEVRNTPVITVVQAPELPTKPASKRLLLKAVLSLAIGSLLGLAVAFAMEFFRRNRMIDPRGAGQFAALSDEVLTELRGIFRGFRFKGGRGA